MCFAPQADLVGGLVVGAIGVDACRHIHQRNTHLLIAGLPLLLGAHQLDEAFVWWGLEGHVPHSVGRVALWVYLVIAFVIVPIFVPTAVFVLEPTPQRRRRMVPFVALGGAVAAVLLTAMLRGPIDVAERPYHLAYSVSLSHGGLVVACGALLFSGYRDIEIFGIGNLVAVGVLAWLTVDGFASLWCAYAALASGAIALHMRYAKPHRDAAHVLS
jgi:hypothetical protein